MQRAGAIIDWLEELLPATSRRPRSISVAEVIVDIPFLAIPAEAETELPSAGPNASTTEPS
jgi:hypothetical protein